MVVSIYFISLYTLYVVYQSDSTVTFAEALSKMDCQYASVVEMVYHGGLAVTAPDSRWRRGCRLQLPAPLHDFRFLIRIQRYPITSVS